MRQWYNENQCADFPPQKDCSRINICSRNVAGGVGGVRRLIQKFVSEKKP